MLSCVEAIDWAVLTFLAEHRTPALTALTVGLWTVRESLVGMTLAALVVAVLVVRWDAYRRLAAAVLAAAAGELVGAGLKQVFERPRAPAALQLLEPMGYAFPSTHACWTAAAVVAFLLAAPWASAARRACTWAGLATLALLIGASMIYLGAHWLSDVLLGWVLGTGIGAATGVWLRRGAASISSPHRGEPSPRSSRP